MPLSISKFLECTGLTFDSIDLIVFHQVSKLVIESIIRTLSPDKSKVFTNFENVGNTVSASIPIALKHAQHKGG